MFEILLYVNIACQDAADMISRVKANEDMSKIVKTEIVETLKEATTHCKWDAHD